MVRNVRLLGPHICTVCAGDTLRKPSRSSNNLLKGNRDFNDEDVTKHDRYRQGR